MRVIAGTRKGTPLKSLEGLGTRPTSDKVKESIFNIIGPYFNGGVVVELFGGSGSLSLEAISRGIDEAYIFEKNMKACAVIKANVEKCHFSNQVHIQRMDARNAVASLQATAKKAKLLFIDPPYAEIALYALVEDFVSADLLTENAAIICEHDKQLVLPECYGPYCKIKSSVYGNIAVSIYEK